MNGKWTALALSFIVLLILASSIRPVEAADWPQLGNNPQRQNYSPETITPPYTIKWQVDLHNIDPANWIYAAAQVVTGDGKVYIGTKKGILYAFNATTGAQEWTFETGGPILHTAGYANGKVFVASMDGCVYGIDTSDGSQAWCFDSQRRYGFCTAVLLAEGKVFAVDMGGYLYALNQSDGSQAWSQPYDAGAPVVHSPSYNNGRIFFGSEDMVVQAVNSSNGSLAWESDPVWGMMFINFFPVIHDGRVIVRTRCGFVTSNYSSDDSLQDMYWFNENTGAELSVIAHDHVLAMDDPIAPPSITSEGYAVLPHAYNDNDHSSGWKLANFNTQTYVENLTTGGTSSPVYGDMNVGDRNEMMATSVVGNVVIAVHTCGRGWGNPAPAQNCAYNRSNQTGYMLPRPSGLFVYILTQGGGANSVSTANGLLYHQAMKMVYCMQP